MTSFVLRFLRKKTLIEISLSTAYFAYCTVLLRWLDRNTLDKQMNFAIKIVEREFGIERIYRSADGLEHSIPTSLDSWLFSSYAYSNRRRNESKRLCLFG